MEKNKDIGKVPSVTIVPDKELAQIRAKHKADMAKPMTSLRYLKESQGYINNRIIQLKQQRIVIANQIKAGEEDLFQIKKLIELVKKAQKKGIQ